MNCSEYDLLLFLGFIRNETEAFLLRKIKSRGKLNANINYDDNKKINFLTTEIFFYQHKML